MRRKTPPLQLTVWNFPAQKDGEQILPEFWVGITKKERKVDFVEQDVEEDEVTSTGWTFNLEVFLLNSQKQHLLQHVECYLPRIIF